VAAVANAIERSAPLSSQATASPSMMQDREGRRTNVSTISGLIGKPVRFLGHVLANLTERRFRALWAQTDKNVRREELRFEAQGFRLLLRSHAGLLKMTNPACAAVIREAVEDWAKGR